MYWYNVGMFLMEAYICWILTAEYFYDRKIYEAKRRKIKRTKNQVVVKVEEGRASIISKPKDVDVVINHKD